MDPADNHEAQFPRKKYRSARRARSRQNAIIVHSPSLGPPTMSRTTEENTYCSTQDPETREMPHIPRVIDYAFKVDCTLYLENETQVRREVGGKWCAIRLLNDDEWQADAERTLTGIVGSMHLHDSGIPARVMRHVVHCWRKW
jgi:hypothetical protein